MTKDDITLVFVRSFRVAITQDLDRFFGGHHFGSLDRRAVTLRLATVPARLDREFTGVWRSLCVHDAIGRSMLFPGLQQFLQGGFIVDGVRRRSLPQLLGE